MSIDVKIYMDWREPFRFELTDLSEYAMRMELKAGGDTEAGRMAPNGRGRIILDNRDDRFTPNSPAFNAAGYRGALRPNRQVIVKDDEDRIIWTGHLRRIDVQMGLRVPEAHLELEQGLDTMKRTKANWKLVENKNITQIAEELVTRAAWLPVTAEHAYILNRNSLAYEQYVVTSADNGKVMDIPVGQFHMKGVDIDPGQTATFAVWQDSNAVGGVKFTFTKKLPGETYSTVRVQIPKAGIDNTFDMDFSTDVLSLLSFSTTGARVYLNDTQIAVYSEAILESTDYTWVGGDVDPSNIVYDRLGDNPWDFQTVLGNSPLVLGDSASLWLPNISLPDTLDRYLFYIRWNSTDDSGWKVSIRNTGIQGGYQVNLELIDGNGNVLIDEVHITDGYDKTIAILTQENYIFIYYGGFQIIGSTAYFNSSGLFGDDVFFEDVKGIISSILVLTSRGYAVPYTNHLQSTEGALDFYGDEENSLTTDPPSMLNIQTSSTEPFTRFTEKWKEDTDLYQAFDDLAYLELGYGFLDREGKLNLYDFSYPYTVQSIESIDLDKKAQDARYEYGKDIINSVEVLYYPKIVTRDTIVWENEEPIEIAADKTEEVKISTRSQGEEREFSLLGVKTIQVTNGNVETVLVDQNANGATIELTNTTGSDITTDMTIIGDKVSSSDALYVSDRDRFSIYAERVRYDETIDTKLIDSRTKAETLAKRILLNKSTPHPSIKSFTLKSTDWGHVEKFKIGDVVEISSPAKQIDKVRHIITGENHSLQPGFVTTRYDTISLRNFSLFVLNQSELDSNDKLA